MIEEYWKDVTLYSVYMVDDENAESKEGLSLFLFYSETNRNEILDMLTNFYGTLFKKNKIIIDELEDGLQLIR